MSDDRIIGEFAPQPKSDSKVMEGFGEQKDQEKKYGKPGVIPAMMGLLAHLEFQQLMLNEDPKLFLKEFKEYLKTGGLAEAVYQRIKDEAILARDQVKEELGPDLFSRVKWIKEPIFSAFKENTDMIEVLWGDAELQRGLATRFGTPEEFVRQSLLDPNLKLQVNGENGQQKILTATDLFEKGREMANDIDTVKFFLDLKEKEDLQEVLGNKTFEQKASLLFASVLGYYNVDFRGTKYEWTEGVNRLVMMASARIDLWGLYAVNDVDTEALEMVGQAGQIYRGHMLNFNTKTKSELEESMKMTQMIADGRIGTVFAEMKNTYGSNDETGKLDMRAYAANDAAHSLASMFEYASRLMNLPGDFETKKDYHWRQILTLMERGNWGNSDEAALQVAREESEKDITVRRVEPWMVEEPALALGLYKSPWGQEDRFQSIYWLAKSFLNPTRNHFLLIQARCPWINKDNINNKFGGLELKRVQASEAGVETVPIDHKEILPRVREVWLRLRDRIIRKRNEKDKENESNAGEHVDPLPEDAYSDLESIPS